MEMKKPLNELTPEELKELKRAVKDLLFGLTYGSRSEEVGNGLFKLQGEINKELRKRGKEN